MDLENIVHQVLSIAGTFNLRIVIFLICTIGEFGVAVPYLLEIIWLQSGYHVTSGVLSPFHMLLLWLPAVVGRQTGATVFYYLARFGSMPLKKLYQKYFKVSLSDKLSNSNTMPVKLLRRIGYLSPFSIALGRLFGLRVAITLTLGIKRRLTTLSLGVLLSSLVWDSVYILLGIIGGRAVLKPIQMLLYSIVGLTLLYTMTFIIRRLLRSRLSGEA